MQGAGSKLNTCDHAAAATAQPILPQYHNVSLKWPCKGGLMLINVANAACTQRLNVSKYNFSSKVIFDNDDQKLHLLKIVFYWGIFILLCDENQFFLKKNERPWRLIND